MSEWQLPSIAQLKSLRWCDYIAGPERVSYKPALEAAYRLAFLDNSVFVWSASTYGNSYASWAVDFGSGRAMPLGITGQCKVRLVRGAKNPQTNPWCSREAATNRYVISECETFVHDRATNLEWKRNCEPGHFDFAKSLIEFGLTK